MSLASRTLLSTRVEYGSLERLVHSDTGRSNPIPRASPMAPTAALLPVVCVALTARFWPSAAVTVPPSQAGRPQTAADLADAAARSRDRGCPLALSDGDAGFIGIG